jgi:hypothetical protein
MKDQRQMHVTDGGFDKVQAASMETLDCKQAKVGWRTSGGQSEAMFGELICEIND